MPRHDDIALPLIDQARCTGCGLCEQLCPTHAVLVLRGRARIVHPEACNFCDVCETYCPEGAIGRPYRIVFAPEAGAGEQGAA
jgi:MinD superfamily P-loop ATPase